MKTVLSGADRLVMQSFFDGISCSDFLNHSSVLVTLIVFCFLVVFFFCIVTSYILWKCYFVSKVTLLIEECEVDLINRGIDDFSSARAVGSTVPPAKNSAATSSQLVAGVPWKWSGNDFVRSPTEEPWVLHFLFLDCTSRKYFYCLRSFQIKGSRYCYFSTFFCK